MTAVLAVYDAALRGGAATLVRPDGSCTELPVVAWTGAADAGDRVLLGRCTGSTLDIGCGPGRLVAALTETGVPALGIDISRRAVEMTRARGAMALRRDVFSAVPAPGRWSHVLLADGNIGIGGDPVRLLIRCAELLSPDGSVLLDVGEPGTGLVAHDVRLRVGRRSSDCFRWSWLDADVLPVLAEPAGLRLADIWSVADRWQAELVRTVSWSAPGSRGGGR